MSLIILLLSKKVNAVALLWSRPDIADKFTCVWIGGGVYENRSLEYNINNDFRAANTVFIVIPDQGIDKFCCRSGIRACLKIEEMTDIWPKMVSFKKKTQSNRSLTRLFDAEDDRFGAKSIINPCRLRDRGIRPRLWTCFRKVCTTKTENVFHQGNSIYFFRKKQYNKGHGNRKIKRRNNAQKGIDWHFTSDDARTMLKHLYPIINF